MEKGIDVVILWVDGECEKFKSIYSEEVRKLRVAGIQIQDQKGRHRDNGELIFLLRSIHENMRWHGSIYIVTNGQRPKYINFDHPKINLVQHDQLFPKMEDAPSFNTFAIDSVVHRIPGLSENFIRFSDDFFIGRHVKPSDFMGSSGEGRFLFGGRFFNIKRNRYNSMLQYNAIRFWQEFGYLPFVNSLHVPQFRKKFYQEALINKWCDWFTQTRHNKFRSEQDANMLFLYPYFVIAECCAGNFHEEVFNVFDSINKNKNLYKQVNVGTKGWREHVEGICACAPMFFNLNDAMQDGKREGSARDMLVKLRKIFPVPSPYERDAAQIPEFNFDEMH